MIEAGRLYRVKGSRRIVRAEHVARKGGVWWVTERTRHGNDYVCWRSYRADRLIPVKERR